MRLYQQLVLFMLAATVLPLALLGFHLLRAAERELSLRIGREQRAMAEAAAGAAADQVMGAVRAVTRPAEIIDWAQASAEEAQGGLRLLLRQAPALSAVLLLSPQGQPLTEPFFVPEGEGGHPGFELRGLEALVRALSPEALRQIRPGEAAVSPAYLHSLGKMAALAFALRPSGAEGSPLVLAEMGLGELNAALGTRGSGEAGTFDIVDGAGRVIASAQPARLFTELAPALWAAVQAQLEGGGGRSFSVDVGAPMLVAATRVPEQLGLVAVVAVEQGVALAPVRNMRRTVLASIAVALAVLLVLGALFTRRLNARLGRVLEGAEAFGRGELGRRIPVSGTDELSELSSTFNRMGGELEAAQARLLRWNDDLRQKVEEATAELKAAQAQLLEAQKLAAVGQLGAGVAHEINNPLAGILGNTQLLLLEKESSHPEFETLRKIEQGAKRCKEITQNLLRFSQQRERAALRPLDLNAVVRDAISLAENQTRGEGIALAAELWPQALTVRGDPGHLSQVVMGLLSNARTAMAKSAEKRLWVITRQEGGEAVIEVRDTGKGIKPEHLPRIFEPFFTTKDVWSNVGLGLSIAYRVVAEHAGKIEVATELGKGSAFTVRLPKLDPRVPPAPVPSPSAEAVFEPGRR